jgi:hypothetical protein
MQKLVFLVLFVFSQFTYSWDYNASFGMGLKYGGLVGYQATFSEGNHNLRGALGLFGSSVGYDYKVFDHFSIGATIGDYSSIVSVSTFHTLNVTYHFSGNYSEGWNISFDLGRSRCSADCIVNKEDYDNISAVSLGYTF